MAKRRLAWLGKWTRRAVVLLVVLAAVGVLGVGAVSYARAVPGPAIWIPHTKPAAPYVRAAMIEGVLHVVRVVPQEKRGSLNKEQKWGGFYVRQMDIGLSRGTGVGVPFWALGVPLAVWPSVAFVRGPIRRRRRRKRGECIGCGYKLTGLTERRCPECGMGF
ncbi:MAG: hypothetical protein JXB13_21150 [Phycisphaerae bacterium]|nr:hypothetical protein [Phycisphaerae bacterium]